MDDIDIFDQRITLSMIEDLGYKSLFNYCEGNFDCKDFEDKAAMVVGYKRIEQRDPRSIYISEDVVNYINNTLKPYTDNMGIEVPFFLLGNSVYDLNGMSLLINRVMTLNDSIAQRNEAVFKSDDILKVEDEIKSDKYNVVIIGHSHPKITSNAPFLPPKEKALWEYLRSLKSELDLRGDNLDVTIKDIATLVTFSNNIKYINKNAIVMSGIYHNNGELNFMYYDGKYGLALATNVYKQLDNGSYVQAKNYDVEDMRKVK